MSKVVDFEENTLCLVLTYLFAYSYILKHMHIMKKKNGETDGKRMEENTATTTTTNMV